jgi:hypothetical protein
VRFATRFMSIAGAGCACVDGGITEERRDAIFAGIAGIVGGIGDWDEGNAGGAYAWIGAVVGTGYVGVDVAGIEEGGRGGICNFPLFRTQTPTRSFSFTGEGNFKWSNKSIYSGNVEVGRIGTRYSSRPIPSGL